MKNSNDIEEEVPGTLTQEVNETLKTLTVEQVEKWIIDDLGRARSLLQALHNDRNILRLVATHIHGLASNSLHAKLNAERLKSEK